MNFKIKIEENLNLSKIFLNPDLSAKTRGVFAYIFIKTGKDRETLVTEEDILKDFKKDKIERINQSFKELEDAGIIILKKKSQLEGLIKKNIYHYQTAGVR